MFLFSGVPLKFKTPPKIQNVSCVTGVATEVVRSSCDSENSDDEYIPDVASPSDSSSCDSDSLPPNRTFRRKQKQLSGAGMCNS